MDKRLIPFLFFEESFSPPPLLPQGEGGDGQIIYCRSKFGPKWGFWQLCQLCLSWFFWYCTLGVCQLKMNSSQISPHRPHSGSKTGFSAIVSASAHLVLHTMICSNCVYLLMYFFQIKMFSGPKWAHLGPELD